MLDIEAGKFFWIQLDSLMHLWSTGEQGNSFSRMTEATESYVSHLPKRLSWT